MNAGPAILAAIIRLFVHVCGRDTVRSIMARRDVYSKEASSVSLRGSIAVVTKRLNEHVKKLAAKAKAQSDAIPAAMPTQSLPDHDPDRVAHHAEADGVDEMAKCLWSIWNLSIVRWRRLARMMLWPC